MYSECCFRVEEDEASSMIDSAATSSPQAALQVVAADPPSIASNADITVESSPHNVYLSTTNVAAHTKNYQLESDQSVRV